MLSPIAKERLAILSDFLENDKRVQNRFDLSTWLTCSELEALCEAEEKRLGHELTYEEECDLSLNTVEAMETCGTTACAFGWATAIPEFIDLGLRMDLSGSPAYEDETDMNAAETFFDVVDQSIDMGGYSLDIASFLFDPINYKQDELKKPRAVVRRIRKLLKGQTKFASERS